MLFAANSTSLIQRVQLLDDFGDPITGVDHDSSSLEIAYNLQSDGLWVVTTLVAGTLGTYLANSWVAIGEGLYQWCPPNAAIVANATTLVRATYAANAPQYGKIEARLPKVDASAGVELDAATIKRFVTEDTGETVAAVGSVAKLAQGAGGGDATLAKQNEILDAIDTYASSALATVNGTSGTIVGFPTTLNVGDSYTDEANSAIHVFIRDANDDPITSVGDFEFTDSTFAPKLIITQSGTTSRVKATLSYVDPGVAESYLKVEIPPSESRRVSAGVATMQCVLQWVDTDGKVLCQKTLAKQAVTWNEMI